MTRTSVITTAALSLSLAAPAAAVERWNLASILPSGSFQLESAEAFAAVRDGLVEMADIQMNRQIGEDPFFGIESLPFLASGYDDLARLQAITRPYFDEIAARKNQKILYITPWPPQNVFANVAIIDDPASFDGVKIRTIDKNATDLFNGLGAAAVQTPWGEVVPALQEPLSTVEA